MAQIREYTSQISSGGDIGGPRATAISFGNAGAAEIGKGLSNTGDVLQDVADRQEVSDVHARLAQARADWTVALQERATQAQPGDATFAGKFNEDFRAYLEKMDASIQTRAGQQAFRRGAADLSAHFVEKAGLYQAQSMGAKAKLDYKVALDANRSALLSDFTQFDSVLKSMDQSIEDRTGPYARLMPEQRAELQAMTRKQLALSAVQGMILAGAPELAKKQLTGGKWDAYLDADDRFRQERNADVAIHGKAVEAERLRAAEERARKEEVRATQEEIVQKLATNKLTANDILRSSLPAVGDGSKEHFLNVLRTRSKEAAEAPVKTMPSVMMNLFDDIRSGRLTSTQPIEQRYLAKQLTFEDMNRLRKEFSDMRSPEGEKLGQRKKAFFDGIKPQIDKSNPLMGKLDPSGAQAFYEFTAHVDRQVEAYRAANKPVYDLFDPTKPDYLGSPATVKAFQKPLQQSIRDISARTTGAPQPLPPEQQRKPGETPQQWLERTRK